MLKVISITVAGLILPQTWDTRAVLQGAQSQGLLISSWEVAEPIRRVRRWLDNANFCEPLIAAPDHDWHCVNETTLYSLLHFNRSLLWVQSQQRGDLSTLPYNLSGDIVGTYNNTFERVYVFRSEVPPTTIAIQFEALQGRRGARLQMSEQDSTSFLQRWTYGSETVVITGQRESSGLTLVVLSKGTVL